MYHIPDNFTPTALPHGNSKSSRPFIPTWSSTLIKHEAKSAGPKDVVSSVSAKVGEVVGARAPGELPRGERQVINAKRALKLDCS